MARDRGSIVKMSRREGYALHPKAHKALVKRTALPGQKAGARPPARGSQYAIQLREKRQGCFIDRLTDSVMRYFVKMNTINR